MESIRPFPSARLAGLVLAALAMLLLMGFADRAAAYSQPPGGKWNFQNLFEDTKRGALSLSKNGSKVTKLVLVPGENESEECGEEPIRLMGKPKIRSFRKAGGRYAVANIKGGLFVGKPLTFKQGKRKFRATLELTWGEDSTIMDDGQFERGDCYLSFFARKGR